MYAKFFKYDICAVCREYIYGGGICVTKGGIDAFFKKVKSIYSAVLKRAYHIGFFKKLLKNLLDTRGGVRSILVKPNYNG